MATFYFRYILKLLLHAESIYLNEVWFASGSSPGHFIYWPKCIRSVQAGR
jgi:hypothetical protein